MRTTRSVLCSFVAGLAQEAELPVGAMPIDYVRAGFYCVPGTDACAKIGRHVRAEAAWGTHGNRLSELPGKLNNRTINNLAELARGISWVRASRRLTCRLRLPLSGHDGISIR